MKYHVTYEQILEPGFEGWYYAHIPAFDLTTHGLGIYGAHEMAEDMLKVWILSSIDHGDPIPTPDGESLDSIDSVTFQVDALQVA